MKQRNATLLPPSIDPMVEDSITATESSCSVSSISVKSVFGSKYIAIELPIVYSIEGSHVFDLLAGRLVVVVPGIIVLLPGKTDLGTLGSNICEILK